MAKEETVKEETILSALGVENIDIKDILKKLNPDENTQLSRDELLAAVANTFSIGEILVYASTQLPDNATKIPDLKLSNVVEDFVDNTPHDIIKEIVVAILVSKSAQ